MGYFAEWLHENGLTPEDVALPRAQQPAFLREFIDYLEAARKSEMPPQVGEFSRMVEEA